ncbi:Acetyl-coenzyme A synthetase [Providencia alcalifaciens]|uniref:Acetyl-coenzyme A synthetase n=1 Tax=Providencia alcalifaciens 205/92 TaxID=1256988 RepID=A0AAV3M9V2_9GAMM|nr:acetate--CoA ligase [Providencia alcalifaciens]EKT62139.1 acetyl-CoA synthetase [Providencia alcalifaciens Dmel2]EUD04887.1 acetate--CoA ligase [Providencia alcalifaciens RIMD 1656011]EUD12510.1 acetate--CoA ligase [Providencia alcalifaciens 205/92]MTC15845.1 acetate--CoA ligase [Providencia alcalifaciens]MTC62744.1 acetate--CoA ligase [Providencia alcalifaciens]
MTQITKHPVPANIAKNALINEQQYNDEYQRSIQDPEGFWGEKGKIVDWIKPYTRVKNTSFDPGHVNIRWFEDGTLNLSANCLDRHLATRGDQTAIIWEGDDPTQSKNITYRELHHDVCQFANVLKKQGIRKGDVVAIYMPMVVEAAVAMLACARIGAIHTVIFAGFSPEAVSGRVIDCKAKLIITSDEGLRAGRAIPLKKNVDDALQNPQVTTVANVIVYRRTGNAPSWVEGRDLWWHDVIQGVSADCPPEEINAEDPLFILYTSGSTGKPKGVLHTTGGYLVYATLTFKYTFDYHENEVYWCTADVGWVTGHSYLLYGPLSNGAKTLMFEGVPNYPAVNRMAQIVDKHQVNILYTAPTAIRALMAEGDKAIEGTQRDSLRILGSVGEPINPEAWEWFYKKMGNSRCPVVDTWWQTETGGFMITPLPGATMLKPGSATLPFFGVRPALVDNLGEPIEGATEGNLVIVDSWPGQARTLFGDHERFEQTYFSTFKGMYFSGDGARRDEDGYYWITGRVDDVLNISGHRLGTAEIESALVSHPKVAEAAVVGIPHSIKGQAIYAYVTLISGEEPSPELYTEVRNWVRKEIGPIATPDVLHWTDSLPKTRSGKIMRRILRKIASGDTSNFGDTSTLADPGVVEKLLEEKQSMSIS